MRAAVYHGPGDVRIEDRPEPVPGDGEVLVRITRAGICGTDASEWKSGPKVFPVAAPHPVTGHAGPLVIGHEFVGVVAGEGAPGFPVGTRVASGAGVSCGECNRCGEGRTNLCCRYSTLGLNRDGGLAEMASVPVSTLVAIPDGLDDDAAGLAQPLAVGLHAARRAGVRDGDRVVLIGAGAIGTFVLAGLLHLADVSVTVLDFGGARLERAARLGAAQTIPVDGDGFEATLAGLARTADVVIEASGAPGQTERAIGLARDGGTVLQVGLASSPQAIDFHGLVFREIRVETTLAHVCAVDLPDALDILGSTDLAHELLEQVCTLEEVPGQLDRLVRGEVEGKILFDPAAEAIGS